MGMVMLNFVGQCGPLLGTRLYPDEDGPFFVRGMCVCAVFMLGVAVLAVALRVSLGRENKRRERVCVRDEGKEEEEDQEVLVGRRKKEEFRFML